MFRFLDRFEMGRLQFFGLVCIAELLYVVSVKLLYMFPEWWNKIPFLSMLFSILLLRSGVFRRLKNAGMSVLWVILIDISLIAYFMPRSVIDFSNRMLWDKSLGGLFDEIMAWVIDIISNEMFFAEFPEIVMDIFGWVSTLGLALIVYLCFAPSKKSSPERDS